MSASTSMSALTFIRRRIPFSLILCNVLAFKGSSSDLLEMAFQGRDQTPSHSD